MPIPAFSQFCQRLLALSSIALLFACGGGGGGGTPALPPPSYSISGSVSGSVQQGVLVSLTGAATAATTTDASGNYSLTGLANGSYTVTPSLAGSTFSPATTSLTINGANATANNYVSSIAAASYRISGTVSGSVQQGVLVTLTGAATATTTTDASGNYSLTGLANGTYTVTPSLAGYTFSPISLAASVSGAMVTGKNFTATASTAAWTVRTSGTTYNLNDVVWSGSKFVAVGSHNTILTSPDGITWTSQHSGAPNDLFGVPYSLFGVAWSGTQFVAVGADSNGFNGIILTSADGISWTTRVSGPTSGSVITTNPYVLYKVIWAGTRFLAVGFNSNGSSGAILTSADGVTWTTKTLATTYSGLNEITWTGAQFVAVGSSGTVIASPDGITWTERSVLTSPYGLYGIAWSGSMLVATGSGTGGGTPILTSPDGITWTPRTSSALDLRGVIWAGTQFVAAHVSGYGSIFTSPTGVTWTEQPSSVGSGYGLVAVVWSGTRYVAVGTPGAILTLP